MGHPTEKLPLVTDPSAPGGQADGDDAGHVARGGPTPAGRTAAGGTLHGCLGGRNGWEGLGKKHGGGELEVQRKNFL